MKLTNLGDVVPILPPLGDGISTLRITPWTKHVLTSLDLLQDCSSHALYTWTPDGQALRTRFACTDVIKGWFPQIFRQPNGHSLSTPDRREYHVRYTGQCLKWTWVSRPGILRVNPFKIHRIIILSISVILGSVVMILFDL